MKTLKEALIRKDNIGNAKVSEPEDLADATSWKVGDIVTYSFNYNCLIPYFFRIEKKVGKATLELVELWIKVVSGAINSPAGYECVPDTTKLGETKQIRIVKGHARINKRLLRKWDGKPVDGYFD